jgi:hypothetical protein
VLSRVSTVSLLCLLTTISTQAADLPEVTITNGQIEAKIYLPDKTKGFYKGTRFDWSGVIHSLRFGGHDFYGPWFTKTDPSIHDFIYQGDDIVAGPCSAITGPVNEFKPIGWDEADVRQTFVKIGVGSLRKPDDKPYDNYRLYEIVDGGKWKIERKPDSVSFTQTLHDGVSGFSYVYTKRIRLVPGKPEMILEQSLKNTGAHPIVTSVYNHNFLVLDGKPLSAGLTVTLPFAIKSPHPPNGALAEIQGNKVTYLKNLEDKDTVATPLNGFTKDVSDHAIQIDNPSIGAGMHIQTNRPLLQESLWSIRSVIAVEPFIAISVDPHHEFSWTSTYGYSTTKSSNPAH